jgi:hypothetical protein
MMGRNMTIEQTIRKQYAGAWYLLFHSAGDRFKFLPTGETISADKYEAIQKIFSPDQEAQQPTSTERQRNNVRAKAEAATRGAGG